MLRARAGLKSSGQADVCQRVRSSALVGLQQGHNEVWERSKQRDQSNGAASRVVVTATYRHGGAAWNDVAALPEPETGTESLTVWRASLKQQWLAGG